MKDNCSFEYTDDRLYILSKELGEELLEKAEGYSFESTSDGQYILPEDLEEELLERAENIEREESIPMAHPIYGSKHTYCCKMGSSDGRPIEQQQFRSYSFQAPLFCMRMARNNGHSAGSVSRGGCD